MYKILLAGHIQANEHFPNKCIEVEWEKSL